jgi:hypothetical protein
VQEVQDDVLRRSIDSRHRLRLRTALAALSFVLDPPAQMPRYGARLQSGQPHHADEILIAYHHSPWFGMDFHGSAGGNAGPACNSSIEI